jgi:hypothetical protein
MKLVIRSTQNIAVKKENCQAICSVRACGVDPRTSPKFHLPISILSAEMESGC